MSKRRIIQFNPLLTFDTVVYNLVYPGFVGSMLYELLPTQESELNLSFFFSEISFLKYFIIIFYLTDYFHLYGYVHEIVSKEDRKFWYISTDFVVSLLLFIAYFTVKWGRYNYATLLTLIVLAILLLGYKRKNKYDWYFFVPSIAVLAGLRYLLPAYISSQLTQSLLIVGLAMLIYFYYTFKYFPSYAQYVKDNKLYLI